MNLDDLRRAADEIWRAADEIEKVGRIATRFELEPRDLFDLRKKLDRVDGAPSLSLFGSVPIKADPTVARGTFRIRYSDGTVEEKSLEVRG